MVILGIETSCDETACAVLKKDQNGIHILSNVVASSATLQAKYGGIIPEQAAREQLKSIIPVIKEALKQAFPDVIPLKKGIQPSNNNKDNSSRLLNNSRLELDPRTPRVLTSSKWRLRGDDRKENEDDIIKKVDAIAVTYGPGLIGSLLVGVETAKTLALVWGKPLIPVNHLIGHFYANWITNKQSVYRLPSTAEVGSRKSESIPTFPCIGLLVSGGHTDLVLFEDHGKYRYLGGTRDDAAGECFDKCARLLGLPYPGGPEISKLASQVFDLFEPEGSQSLERPEAQTRRGDALRFDLPRPMIDSKDFDFSFSGLKTAVANLLHASLVIPNIVRNLKIKESRDPSLIVQDDKTIADLAAAIEQAIVDVLVEKTIRAAQTYNIDQIMVAGGVAANQKLISEFKLKIVNCKLKINLHVPPPNLCTDNAAMVASSAFFQKPLKNPLDLQANPNLSLS